MIRSAKSWGAKHVGTVAAGSGALLLAVLGGIWGASANQANTQRAIEANQVRLADHEDRLRVIERDVSQTATDVGWIRKTLERQNGDGG
jgi:hypothetical protein